MAGLSEPQVPPTPGGEGAGRVVIYFNPFLNTIEQNNAYLAAGYEVMPIAVPVIKP